MRMRVWLVGVIAAGFVLGGFALGAVWQISRTPTEAETSQWLFSHTANNGSISPNTDGTWTLTLTDVDPVVLGFTDRPLRDAQAGSVERLVEAWPVMFGDANPNGVVVAHNATGDTNSAVVELMDPVLAGSTLTYTVRVLTNEGGEAAANTSYDFEQVSVFIDDVSVTSWACENPNGGLVDPPGVLNAPIAGNLWRSECEVKGGFPVPQKG